MRRRWREDLLQHEVCGISAKLFHTIGISGFHLSHCLIYHKIIIYLFCKVKECVSFCLPCTVSLESCAIRLRQLTYSISFKARSVLSLCLCLWAHCLIFIRECPSWVRAGWQLVFVFRLQYVCLIQPLIVCGVLFNSPRGMTSVQIAHFIQHRMMMQGDLQPAPAQNHTHTETQTHTPNQSVWQPLLGIIGEREKKKRMKKINRPVATLK